LESGIAFLNGESINTGVLDLTKANFISKGKYESIKKGRILKGDIVMTTRGNGVGQVAYISKNIEGLINAQMLIIRSGRNQLNSSFLYYYLSSDAVQQLIRNFASGSAQPQIPIRDLKSLPLSIPEDQNIQAKIASVLSAYDELIENNKRRIKLLEEMAEEIYKEWFVRFRFPGYEATRFLTEPGKEVPHGTVGALPVGWEKRKLVDLYYINYGKNLSQTEILENGSYPVYGASGVMGFYGDFNIDQKVVLITSRGNGSGEIHRTHEIAFVTNNSFVVVAKEKYKFLEIGFNFQFFNHLNLKSYCTGSAQPQLTNNSMLNIEVYLPDEYIIKKFCAISNSLIELIDNLRTKCQLLQQTRDLLLPRLISGKLSVEHLVEAPGETLFLAAEPVALMKISQTLPK